MYRMRAAHMIEVRVFLCFHNVKTLCCFGEMNTQAESVEMQRERVCVCVCVCAYSFRG